MEFRSSLTATVIALLSLRLVLLGFREYENSWLCSSDKTQGNIRDEVEQKNTDLVQRHATVVHSVKLLTRQVKPVHHLADRRASFRFSNTTETGVRVFGISTHRSACRGRFPRRGIVSNPELTLASYAPSIRICHVRKVIACNSEGLFFVI